MKKLYIRDQRSSGIFLRPADIFEIVAPNTPETFWRIGDFVDDSGEAWFEFANDDWSARKFTEEGMLIPNTQMRALAATMPQAIWVSFFGFRGEKSEPWISLNAIDSSFWRADSDDLHIRRLLRTTFKQVESVVQ